MDCLFCKIVAGQIPASIVKSTNLITAFNDITPQAPTHILIIPNQHFANMAEVAQSNLELAGEIFKTAGEIASELGLDADALLQWCWVGRGFTYGSNPIDTDRELLLRMMC